MCECIVCVDLAKKKKVHQLNLAHFLLGYPLQADVRGLSSPRRRTRWSWFG